MFETVLGHILEKILEEFINNFLEFLGRESVKPILIKCFLKLSEEKNSFEKKNLFKSQRFLYINVRKFNQWNSWEITIGIILRICVKCYTRILKGFKMSLWRNYWWILWHLRNDSSSIPWKKNILVKFSDKVQFLFLFRWHGWQVFDNCHDSEWMVPELFQISLG